jgi:hypothetical protein
VDSTIAGGHRHVEVVSPTTGDIEVAAETVMTIVGAVDEETVGRDLGNESDLVRTNVC